MYQFPLETASHTHTHTQKQCFTNSLGVAYFSQVNTWKGPQNSGNERLTEEFFSLLTEKIKQKNWVTKGK
jgi:hypothetical protein